MEVRDWQNNVKSWPEQPFRESLNYRNCADIVHVSYKSLNLWLNYQGQKGCTCDWALVLKGAAAEHVRVSHCEAIRLSSH